jgi:hypothetical protein
MSWIDVDAATVADAMTTAKKIVGTSRMHPVGMTVRIQHERKTTLIERTNVSDSVRAILSAASAWPTWGPYIVDAAAFASAVGKNGTVRIAPNPEKTALVFASDTGSTSVPLANVEWPSEDRNEYVDAATVAGPELQRVASIADVARKMGSDARAVLAAVSIDSDGTVLATDTYRAHGTRIADVSRGTLVDGTILHVASTSADAGGVHVSTTDTDGTGRTLVEWTSVRGPKKNPRTVHYVVSAFRPEGPFPNIANVIPKDDVSDSWTVRDASGTADVLRTFRPSHAGRTPIVFDAMGSAVRATLSEDGTERSAILPMAVPNLSDTSMAANADYIRDAVLHVGDGARVDMFGALRPFHFVADDDAETFALVMPMRIS